LGAYTLAVREVRRAGGLDGDLWIFPGDNIDEGRVVAAGWGRSGGLVVPASG